MTSIFVAKLDFGVTGEQLKSTFEQYGTVLKATVAMDRETGKSKGFAFIEMSDRDEALEAIEALNDSTLSGRSIAVKEAEQRASRPARSDGDRSSTPGQSRPFTPRPESFGKQPDSSQSGDSEAVFNTPKVQPSKFDRKKEVLKPKAHKMDAHKKSGKKPRFLIDDDEDDWNPSAGDPGKSYYDDLD
jgi:cold-inducible RNA-binding protein